MIRALFVNSGILGHRTVAGLLQETANRIPDLDAHHVNLSDELTIRDRVIRRLFSLKLAPQRGLLGNLDFRRWRQELNVGLLAARRIAATEVSGRFDLLHLHPQAVAYANLGRLWRTPTIVSIDATQQLAAAEIGSPLTRVSFGPSIGHDHLVFRSAGAITVTSQWAATSVSAHYPDCADKLHVMPYPVREVAPASWVSERSSRGPQALVRVLFMGGDFPRKGGFDLLSAWEIGRFAERAVLDLVTDWPLPADDLPKGVHLVRGVKPHSARWRQLWRDADLFVMPTRDEAFGMVFQEAAAAGVPSVATAINAIPEIVQDGTTGLLVAPGEPVALVKALSDLVGSRELRGRFGMTALQRARTSWAMDTYAERLSKLVHSVRERHVH